MFNPISIVPLFSRPYGSGLLALSLLASVTVAEEPLVELPRFSIHSEQVANQTPVVAFAMPVSALRFEPRVDVQARNLAEGQADVTIRGGVFENTGFKIGAASLYDPQTGHYFAEIPIAPAMLLWPTVLTGATNALSGFNAGVGTVAYGWRPIAQRGEAAVAFGNYASNRQSLYQGIVTRVAGGGLTLGADVELSRSESNGSVPFGDHSFKRGSARVQLRGPGSQTDLFAGTQAKFFGWPNLYTPFRVNETEDLHTQLYIINHRRWTSPDNYWEIGAYSRRNYDDYEFNRLVPGQFNPFQHTTYVRSVSLLGHAVLDAFALSYSAEAMRDSLNSTALVFGRFKTRNYLKLAAAPEIHIQTAAGELKLSAGATYDETNRDGSAVSPVVTAALTRPDSTRLYAEYSESTQVPTYTALNSSSTSGLFRGNSNLGRETSRDLEAGVDFKTAGWTVQGDVFYRWDEHLVDWTYSLASSAARTANPVNTGTFGVQLVATHRSRRCDLVLGYTYLDKTADYGAASIDASFYALNFARHRLTAAVVLRLGAGFELHMDNEFRVQQENRLRVIGGDHAFLTAVGIYYLPPRLRGLEFSLLVDNLWGSEFQDVPAVPAARRQFSLGATCRW